MITKKIRYILLVILVIAVSASFFVYRGKLLNSRKVVVETVEEETVNNQEEIIQEENVGEESGEDVNQDNTGEVEEAEKIKQPAEMKEKLEDTDNFKITNKYVSWGYATSSGRNIDTVIIHSSYDALGPDPYSVSGLINEYKQYGVSPHYLIDRQGNVYRLVDEKNVAYHAGESKVPDGRTDVNNFSIGVEMMNTKSDKFTSAQYNSLNDLLRYLSSKYKIKYTLGHNQIAEGRKTDPWNFSWDRVE